MSRHENRIGELRRERGLTLRQLEEKSGVSANTINQLERGLRRARAGTAHKLAGALGVGVDELEGPADFRARYLMQETEHAANLLLTARRVSEALGRGEFDFAGRFAEILEEGLTDLHESLAEAYAIETGNAPAARNEMQRRLDELVREYEATLGKD